MRPEDVVVLPFVFALRGDPRLVRERLHPPAAERASRSSPPLPLPGLPDPDRRAGQRPDPLLAPPEGPLPLVPRADLAPLPARRGARRGPLPRGGPPPRPRARGARRGAPRDGGGDPGGDRPRGAGPAGRGHARRPRARPRSSRPWRDLPAVRADGLAAFAGAPPPAAAGAAFGAAVVWGVGAAYRTRPRGGGDGIGDVKMIAMIGAFVGPGGVLLTLFVALGRRHASSRASRPSCALSSWRAAFAAARRSRRRARSGSGPSRPPRPAATAASPRPGRRWLEIPGRRTEGDRALRPRARWRARSPRSRASRSGGPRVGKVHLVRPARRRGRDGRVLPRPGGAGRGGAGRAPRPPLARRRPVRRLPRGRVGRRLAMGRPRPRRPRRAGSLSRDEGSCRDAGRRASGPGWIREVRRFVLGGPRLRPLPRGGLARRHPDCDERGPPSRTRTARRRGAGDRDRVGQAGTSRRALDRRTRGVDRLLRESGPQVAVFDSSGTLLVACAPSCPTPPPCPVRLPETEMPKGGPRPQATRGSSGG